MESGEDEEDGSQIPVLSTRHIFMGILEHSGVQSTTIFFLCCVG